MNVIKDSTARKIWPNMRKNTSVNTLKYQDVCTGQEGLMKMDNVGMVIQEYAYISKQEGVKRETTVIFTIWGKRISNRAPASHIKKGTNYEFSHDYNGNRRNADVPPVARDFQPEQGLSSKGSPNMAFLDQRIDRIEKLIQGLVQDKSQGLKRW